MEKKKRKLGGAAAGKGRYVRPRGFHPADFGLNVGGKPRIYPTSALMEEKVIEYFKEMSEKNQPVGIFALSLYLGLDYVTFMMYEDGKRDGNGQNYVSILKQARLAIAAMSEARMLEGNGQVAGPIFHIQQITRRLGEQWKNIGQNEITGKDGKDLPLGPVILPHNNRDEIKTEE